MKILTYNILHGGEDENKSRIPMILNIIKSISPNVAAIQEANKFDKNDYAKLKQFKINFPYSAYSEGLISKSGRRYDVVTISSIPLKKASDFDTSTRNGNLNISIDSEFGKISICNTHLSPKTEDERLIELSKIIESQSKYEHKIILGDLNSLSRLDKYEQKVFDSFNDKQKRKFLKKGTPQYDVTDLLTNLEYVDVTAFLNQIGNTVPTNSNVDVAHECALRLDYIFVSKSLINKVSNIEIIKNSLTEQASDHYPLVLHLK